MEDIKEKSADEMFEELGYEKKEIYYKNDIENVIYFIKDDEYSTNIEFKHSIKLVRVYYGENKAGNFNIDILQAINKKIEELGWI